MISRFIFSALALAALTEQYRVIVLKGGESAFDFCCFFTTESNLFAAAVFLAGALYARSGRQAPSWFDAVRGASVVYMTTTGLVYNLILRGGAGLGEWTDDIVHVVFPLAVLTDWFVVKPRSTVSSRQALSWLAFPVIWLVVTLIHGTLSGWYPYSFLRPNPGYGSVATYCGVILVLISIISIAVARIGPKSSDIGGQMKAGS